MAWPGCAIPPCPGSSWPALAAAWTAVGPVAQTSDELAWATEGTGPATHFGFGGWWFLFVARPIYFVLALAWLWRLALLTLLFRRIAKLGLELVPTHPDRLGGLAFVEGFATIFGPVAFAFSAVLSSQWAHQVMYHDAPLKSFQVPALAFLVLALAFFLAPLLVFVPPLAVAKKRAMLEYGALVGMHGKLVRERWILRQPIENDEILHAPEIGPVADAIVPLRGGEGHAPRPDRQAGAPFDRAAGDRSVSAGAFDQGSPRPASRQAPQGLV